MLGNLLGVLSGMFFGLTLVLLRRDATRGAGDAMPSTVLGNLLAAALSFPFAFGPLRETFSSPGALNALLVLLWLGVVQMGVAYILFAKGVRKISASEASLLAMLEAVFNPVWVFFGTAERPGPWAIAGGAVVIAAIVLRLRSSVQQTGAVPAAGPGQP
jgi:drug/metabolite transporter (DMT)-like permease